MPQLDALRGVAILAVFVQHLGDRFMPFVDGEVTRVVPAALAVWLLTVLHHAHWGVDLFFVLSGFSLSQGYLRAAERGAPLPSARGFWVRRAARVLPAFYVALAVTLLFHRWTFFMPGFGASVLTHLLVLQGYLTPGGIVIIGAAWSLTTEAHFYLLMPLLARPLLARVAEAPLRRFALAAAIIVAAWGSRALLHAVVLEPGVRTGLLEATQRRWVTSRLDEFVLGVVAAALHAEVLRAGLAGRASRFAPVGLALSVSLLVVGFRLEGELSLVSGGSWPYAIIALATGGLVLSATLCEGAALRLLTPGPLCAMGVVSYGVFLYHQLALGLVGSVLRAPGWLSLAANATLAVLPAAAAGAASWVLVERPAMRWASTAARRPPWP